MCGGSAWEPAHTARAGERRLPPRAGQRPDVDPFGEAPPQRGAEGGECGVMAEQTTTTGSEEPTATLPEEDRIRVRAYEISQSEHAGTPEENWARAEQELRGASDASA